MIELRGVSRTFQSAGGAVRAVDDLDLVVPEGSFTTLLGPSGCGKTTTLRIVAGLERPDTGVVTIGGRTVSSPADGVDVPAHRRGLGMVFQSFAVWPHLTVAGNVAYPLRAQRVPRGEVASRVAEALGLVGLDGMGGRRTTELSGGQQQRVALARALVARPSVLLLDEPMSNLDARLRAEVRAQILDLRAALGITVLFVTHDRDEALAMSDEVVVMARGRALAAGRPEDLHAAPGTAEVARLLGAPNVLEGTWRPASATGPAAVVTAVGPVEVADVAAGTGGPAEGAPCAVVVRRDAVRVVGPDVVVTGPVVAGRLVRREFHGETTDLVLEVGGTVLRGAADRAGSLLRPGGPVRVMLDRAGCTLVRP